MKYFVADSKITYQQEFEKLDLRSHDIAAEKMDARLSEEERKGSASNPFALKN